MSRKKMPSQVWTQPPAPVRQAQVWGQPPSAVRPGEARRSATLPAAALLMTIVLSVLSLAAFGQKSPAKSTEDLPSGAMQAKATTSCLECHEARIILQQRLSKPAWTKEVDKMVKWGALVDAADHDALIDYLSTNFSPEQAPYEAQRSAPATTSTSKKPK